ncbi:MAG: NAD(P)H-hydrate dehydratase [Bacteroidales bacterium]|nr:NAD(P)H-hydrate dehydratase [Bacteroidales bacterium]
MKILTSSQIREADAYTIANEPVASIDLMERAARKCTDWLLENIGKRNTFKIFFGPGNNGGDGLAIARQLARAKARVVLYQVKISDKLSQDSLINLERLQEINRVEQYAIHSSNDLPDLEDDDVIIDALFGSGLSRPLDGLAADVVKLINKSGAKVISIDIPSGLFSENNVKNSEVIIRANHTLTFQQPKLAFLFAENEKYTGEWHVLDIGLDKDFISNQKSKYHYIEEDEIRALLKKRTKFAHKGIFGHALLISGSYGKMGAAVLASRASLAAGVGLQTTHTPQCGYGILQTAVPETMVTIDPAQEVVTTIPVVENITAMGVGPGIGTNPFTQEMIKNLIENVAQPLVIDADALNIMARNSDWLKLLPKNTILTPHPGEFDRLAGNSKNGYERHLKQIEFSKKYKVFVVLKGANTSVVTPDGEVYFNTTGNSGMATAGSGDVLTGILLSLLAQKYLPLHACLIGVYIHGLAGDIAAAVKSPESLIASDIINNLGFAFRKLNFNL